MASKGKDNNMKTKIMKKTRLSLKKLDRYHVDVLDMLLNNADTEDIADRLGLRESTVENIILEYGEAIAEFKATA